MVEIRLHGPLAKDFGKVWNLDVQSVQEAVEAIDANMQGFRRKIMALADKGMVFRVRSKHHDYCNDDVHTNLGAVERIDIIPMIVGASAGVRFVLGAVLVVVGVFTAYFGDYTGSVIGLGLSLMVGSVVEWLTPKPTKESSADSLQSWTISGPTNTIDQGNPVPVIYGEVLTGGYAISGGISVSQIYNGTAGPTVTIGGTPAVSDMAGSGGNYTSRVYLAAGVSNMLDPISYAWTKTGFVGAPAVRMTGAATPAIQLEVDFSVADGLITTYTGTVSLTATGKKADNSGATVTATASQLVEVSVDSRIYELNGGGS